MHLWNLDNHYRRIMAANHSLPVQFFWAVARYDLIFICISGAYTETGVEEMHAYKRVGSSRVYLCKLLFAAEQSCAFSVDQWGCISHNDGCFCNKQLGALPNPAHPFQESWSGFFMCMPKRWVQGCSRYTCLCALCLQLSTCEWKRVSGKYDPHASEQAIQVC